MMPALIHQAHFDLHLGDVRHDFKVQAFTGTEAISQPFAFELELVSENPALDLDNLLHRPAFLQFGPDDAGVHGLIDRIAQGDSRKRLTHYSMTLRPHLSYLGHRINQRIFQQQSVPDIIARILQDHGILADRYHFQHSKSMHRLVLGDDQTVFPRLAPLAYQQDSGMIADEPVVKRFNVRLETRTTRTTRRDYDFQKPLVPLESEVQNKTLPDLEDYDYPGRFTGRERGTLLANRALERHQPACRHQHRYTAQSGL